MTELSCLQKKFETESRHTIQAYEQVEKIIKILKARGRGDNPNNLLNEIANVLGLPALGVAGMTNGFKVSHVIISEKQGVAIGANKFPE